ncbi:MAG: hypothetical protein EOO38_03455 [Cytophagaceae bacterium]|nr:MAG: hypothetical protein EOO38_03455 [Cytophagaceae bacterium]
MTLPILFDKETEGAQAWACYDELMEKSRKIGCMPYRLPINKSSLLTSTAANRVHAAIKGALDPRGVFSVGRYLGRN